MYTYHLSNVKSCFPQQYVLSNHQNLMYSQQNAYPLRQEMKTKAKIEIGI